MAETTSRSEIRILFVDDEENILKALKRLVMDEDWTILTASSGAEGLDRLKENLPVALIVSDQRMPGLSGAEFLAQAREISPDSQRIVLTGYADIQAAVDAINKGGAHRYLTKPWQDEDLLQNLHTSINYYQLHMENQRLSELVRHQNEELKDWNSKLKQRVLEQTASLRRKSDELSEANDQLRHIFDGTILAFSHLIELRDRQVTDHSSQVAALSEQMALALKLSPDEVRTIRVAALLHDIGKLGVPDAILAKDPEELTTAELAEYRLHPVRGQAAVDEVEALREAGQLIRHHHEHFDGSGYPDQVKGNEIPLGARIIAIADAFDRRNDRSLKEGTEAALASLDKESGSCFDPQLLTLVRQAATIACPTQPAGGGRELSLSPRQLAAGMRVLRDVHSGTGILLLRKGTCLDSATIKALKRYYQIDPPTEAILVQTES
ncbi:MAG TPA: HD domain-containing phosphohydrolase [Desulfuromonadales bacterium]|nr:HD domain-containing phosphohydrolase [Desulfuromonadales bacterium]